jgi:hypothetical protein
VHLAITPRRLAASLPSIAFLLPLAGCFSPLAIFQKSGAAVDPVAQAGGFASVSQCPSFATYQAQADAALQRLCLTCHGSGGQGAANFQIESGDSSDNDLAAANFFVSRDKAVPIGGTVSSGDPDGTSPLLTRLNGTISHPYTLDIFGDDYLVIRTWVVEEVAQTCSIDASTGVVTVVPGA